jgi:hypothetical protein
MRGALRYLRSRNPVSREGAFELKNKATFCRLLLLHTALLRSHITIGSIFNIQWLVNLLFDTKFDPEYGAIECGHRETWIIWSRIRDSQPSGRRSSVRNI